MQVYGSTVVSYGIGHDPDVVGRTRAPWANPWPNRPGRSLLRGPVATAMRHFEDACVARRGAHLRSGGELWDYAKCDDTRPRKAGAAWACRARPGCAPGRARVYGPHHRRGAANTKTARRVDARTYEQHHG